MAKLKQEYYNFKDILKKNRGADSDGDNKSRNGSNLKLLEVNANNGLVDKNKLSNDNMDENIEEVSEIDDSFDIVLNKDEELEIDKNIQNILEENNPTKPSPVEENDDNNSSNNENNMDKDTTRLLMMSEKLDNINKQTKELIEIADGVVKEYAQQNGQGDLSSVINHNWMVDENATSDNVMRISLSSLQWSLFISGRKVVEQDENSEREKTDRDLLSSRGASRNIKGRKQKKLKKRTREDQMLQQDPSQFIQNILADGIRKTLNKTFLLLMKSRSDNAALSVECLNDSSFIEIEFVDAGDHIHSCGNHTCSYKDLYTYRKDVQTLYLSSVLLEPDLLSKLNLITYVDSQDSEVTSSIIGTSIDSSVLKDYEFAGYSFNTIFASSLSIALHCLAHAVANTDKDDDSLFQSTLIASSISSMSIGDIFKSFKSMK